MLFCFTSESLGRYLSCFWKRWAAPISSLQVVTCVRTTGMVNVRCTGLFIRCAASLAPVAPQHPSPCRTSPNGCGIYPERCDSCGNLLQVNAFSFRKRGNLGRLVCVQVCLCTSTVPGLGYGICAAQRIPQGTWIGPFQGVPLLLDKLQPGAVRNTRHLWEVRKVWKLQNSTSTQYYWTTQ